MGVLAGLIAGLIAAECLAMGIGVFASPGSAWARTLAEQARRGTTGARAAKMLASALGLLLVCSAQGTGRLFVAVEKAKHGHDASVLAWREREAYLSSLYCGALATALLLVPVLTRMLRLQDALHRAEVDMRAMRKQAAGHQRALLENLEQDEQSERRKQQEARELREQLDKLRKEAKTERANSEAMRRQAESQASTFEQLMYENNSLRDQLRSLDRKVATSLKKDD